MVILGPQGYTRPLRCAAVERPSLSQPATAILRILFKRFVCTWLIYARNISGHNLAPSFFRQMPKDEDISKGNFKVSKKYGRFNETIRKATRQLAKQSAACAVIQQEVQWAQEREKVRLMVFAVQISVTSQTYMYGSLWQHTVHR